MIKRLALILVTTCLALTLTSCKTTGPAPLYAYGGVVFCGGTVIDAAGRAQPAGFGAVGAKWGDCDGAAAPTGLQVKVRTWWHPHNLYHEVCSESGWIGYPTDTGGFTAQAPSILAGCPNADPGDRFSADVQIAFRLNFSDGSSYWRESDWYRGEWEEWTLP